MGKTPLVENEVIERIVLLHGVPGINECGERLLAMRAVHELRKSS